MNRSVGIRCRRRSLLLLHHYHQQVLRTQDVLDNVGVSQIVSDCREVMLPGSKDAIRENRI